MGMTNSDHLRDHALLEIRPQLGLDTTQSRPLERFQHQTLRPLLKLQHSILVRQFQAFLKEHKQHLADQSTSERQAYISHVVKTHKRLRATLFGLISGFMTGDEYDFYLENRSECNKRITQMVIQRLGDALG